MESTADLAHYDAVVVIPAHDASETLQQQLEALAQQSEAPTFLTVVVANNCSDDTVAIARRFQSILDVEVIEANGGKGASYARNVGVRSTSSDIVLHCDADDVVSPRWVAELCAGLDDADVVGGRLVLPQTGGPWWFHDRDVYDLDGLPSSRSVRFVLSCSIGYRRPVFDSVGGFDERLPHGCDDVAFCLLAQRAGYRLGFVDGAAVQYRPRSGWRSVLQQRRSFGSGEAVFRALHTPRELRPPPVELLSSLAGIVRSLSAVVMSQRRRDHLARLAERWGRLLGQADVWRHGRWPSSDLRTALARTTSHAAGRTPPLAGRWGPHVREVTANLSVPVIGGRLFEVRADAATNSHRNERSLIPTLEFLVSHLAHEDTFVDVGAEVGHVTVAAAVLVGPLGRTTAIEQDVELRAMLATNVRRVAGGDVSIQERWDQRVTTPRSPTGIVVVRLSSLDLVEQYLKAAAETSELCVDILIVEISPGSLASEEVPLLVERLDQFATLHRLTPPTFQPVEATSKTARRLQHDGPERSVEASAMLLTMMSGRGLERIRR